MPPLQHQFLHFLIMKVNVGSADRLIRIVLGIVFFSLYLFDIAAGAWGIAAIVAGTAMLLTALVRFCGLYALLGISTCPIETHKATGEGR